MAVAWGRDCIRWRPGRSRSWTKACSLPTAQPNQRPKFFTQSTHVWPPTSGHPRLATHVWPPTSGHPRLATHVWPPTSGHPRLATHVWPLICNRSKIGANPARRLPNLSCRIFLVTRLVTPMPGTGVCFRTERIGFEIAFGDDGLRYRRHILNPIK